MIDIKNVLVLAFLVSVMFAHSQNSSLPAMDIYTLDGAMIKASDISNEGKIMVIVFWRTYNKDGRNQMQMLNEVYQEKYKEKDVKFIAICTDCIGKIGHIRPIVYGQDIEMDVYIDKNGELSRSLAISSTPYTVLFDRQMNVHCKYYGYCANGDEMVCKKIDECMAEINEE